MAAKVDERSRNFATIVYPESAPIDWIDILNDYCVPCFISPLHDKDINPTGEPKKPHYHVMLMFENKKADRQIQDIFDSIGGVGLKKLQSIRGYARYLLHLDNPEKYQYDEKEIISIGGADYSSIISIASDKYAALDEMQEFCDEYNITSFYLLCRYATKYKPDWSRILKDSGSVYMREYLKSKLWSQETDQIHIINPNTGEVIL